MDKFFNNNQITVTSTTSATLDELSGIVTFSGISVSNATGANFVDFTINNSFIPSLSLYFKPNIEMIYFPAANEYLEFMIISINTGVIKIRAINNSNTTCSNNITFCFRLENYQK